MKVVVTGAAGFLGARVADALLQDDSPLRVTRLVLVDVSAPAPRPDRRVVCLALDIAKPGAADQLLDADTAVLYHLAGVVSGQAEADYELGMRVNLDATRALLETTRRIAPKMRVVFASSCAVYGGILPERVDETTATTPQSSYGTAKAISELLLSDNTRRGWADGVSLRLPTVTVRPGAPNTAVTSFASGIVREPLNGKDAECPVAESTLLWVASPSCVVHNIVAAGALPAAALGTRRQLLLPGITVSVRDMLAALAAVGGPKAVARVHFVRNDMQRRIVESIPQRFDDSYARSLGFIADVNFEEIIRNYVRQELKRSD